MNKLIKADKKDVHAVLLKGEITGKELMTALIGAESRINFLHGQAGGRFAPDSVDETEFHPRNRWRRVQEPISHFWCRWIREWLPSLNAR